MLYLLTAIICSSLFSIILKFCQQHDADGDQVILFNYITAFIFTWVPVLFGFANGSMAASDFVLPLSSWLLALVQGLLFMLGFVVMDRSTSRTGVALTTASARASLILPVILSWILLSQPAPSWLSVALIIISMLMIILPTGGVRPRDGRDEPGAIVHRKAVLALAGVFFVYGLSDFFLKVVQNSVEVRNAGDPGLMENQLTALMGTIFLMASIASLAVCLMDGSFRRHPLSWRGILGGLCLGLANLGCTASMLRALGTLSTGLFYPLYNIGIVIVATLVGVLVFKEKLGWIQIAGLALALLAIGLSF